MKHDRRAASNDAPVTCQYYFGSARMRTASYFGNRFASVDSQCDRNGLRPSNQPTTAVYDDTHSCEVWAGIEPPLELTGRTLFE